MGQRWQDLFESHPVACKNFAKGRKLPLTDKIAEFGMKKASQDSEEGPAIRLENEDVWIRINKTNCQRISKKYGDDVDKWIGKRIKVDLVTGQYKGEKCLSYEVTPA